MSITTAGNLIGHSAKFNQVLIEYGANRTSTINGNATFTYNSRHLVTNIAYDTSQAPNVVATQVVSFGYDAAGNRTSMTDGLGSMAYAYDQLSRLTSETRTFTAIGGSYTLTYGGYNRAGELTSFTNPWGAQVGYSYDKAGRLTAVTGSGYAGVSSYASGLTYRAFGGIKGMTYGNGRNLSVTYDNRLRPTRWNFGTTQDYKYFYDYFNEHTGRVTYAQNMNDNRLDRSYEYDNFGRLAFAHTGAEARAATGQGPWGTMDGPYSLGFGYDVWGNDTHRYGWGGEVQGGGAGQSSDLYYSYGSNNRRTGFDYDAAGNLTFDGGQHFTYDATGQQVTASYSGYSLDQAYDGNGLRVKKTENGTDTTYYLRSSLFGGQVVAEIKLFGSSWGWNRGYVYSGLGLLAVQYGLAVSWVHEDPITKSKRITNSSGTITSSIELDPWGADAGTAWSSNSAFQPRKFTTYDRDANGSDEAMFRRHNRQHSRFDQPDPYDGSYDLTDPQSFNRYAYVQNDPVNLTDPTGLLPMMCGLFMQYVNGDPIGEGYQCFGENYPFAGFFGGGGGGGDHGEDGGVQPQNPKSVCDRMADDAQTEADKALLRNPLKERPDLALQPFNQAFGMITFGSYFTPNIGGFSGTPASGRNNVLGNRDYQGDSGFDSSFKDTLNPGEDQVHHFGAYFSAGLTGHKFISNMHRAEDRESGNIGDVKLADQAYRLGDYLRNSPNQLGNVGQLIRDTICNGKAVPK